VASWCRVATSRAGTGSLVWGAVTRFRAGSQMVAEKHGKPRFGAKSEFVRSLDRSLSAAEVIALAQKKGMTLSPAFVYNIRSADSNRNQASARASKRAPRAAKATSKAPLRGAPEAQLRAAIAQIGLARAREILEEVEETFAGR
jgi:hypothetical protein